jgi:hypothetical protein
MGEKGTHTNYDVDICWETSLGKPRKAVNESITMKLRIVSNGISAVKPAGSASTITINRS